MVIGGLMPDALSVYLRRGGLEVVREITYISILTWRGTPVAVRCWQGSDVIRRVNEAEGRVSASTSGSSIAAVPTPVVINPAKLH